MSTVQRKIEIDEELYREAKARAAKEGMSLMNPDGWISQAIKEKLEIKDDTGKIK